MQGEQEDMGMAERRGYPRLYPESTQVYLYVQGEGVQRCKVRCLSRAGVFLETAARLPEGSPVELAFTVFHSDQLVKMYRRSAYLARASDSGLAVLFFTRNAA